MRRANEILRKASAYYAQAELARHGNTSLITCQPGDPRTWGATIKATF